MKQMKVYVYAVELAEDNENALIETLQYKLHSDEVEMFFIEAVRRIVKQ